MCAYSGLCVYLFQLGLCTCVLIWVCASIRNSKVNSLSLIKAHIWWGNWPILWKIPINFDLYQNSYSKMFHYIFCAKKVKKKYVSLCRKMWKVVRNFSFSQRSYAKKILYRVLLWTIFLYISSPILEMLGRWHAVGGQKIKMCWSYTIIL